jgi:hypothetical protein
MCSVPGFTPQVVISVGAVPTAIDPFVIGMIVTSDQQQYLSIIFQDAECDGG